MTTLVIFQPPGPHTRLLSAALASKSQICLIPLANAPRDKSAAVLPRLNELEQSRGHWIRVLARCYPSGLTPFGRAGVPGPLDPGVCIRLDLKHAGDINAVSQQSSSVLTRLGLGTEVARRSQYFVKLVPTFLGAPVTPTKVKK